MKAKYSYICLIFFLQNSGTTGGRKGYGIFFSMFMKRTTKKTTLDFVILYTKK